MGMTTSTRRELGSFAAAYAVYDLGRWAAHGGIGAATAHARWVLALERSLGVAVERPVQHALAGAAVMWLLSNVYLAAQLAVLPASLVYLYRRAPHVYRRLRNTVLWTWLLAVPVYAAFPVAPPRLAHIGISDAVSRLAAVQLTGRSTLFYNDLAAVPSLHCGFAVAIGIALAAAARRPAARALWLLWGPLVCVAVVATGNHYVFDIAAGLLASVLGYLLGRLSPRVPVLAHPLRPRRTP
jgi:membrane-associated phospholipid phosphatase